MILFALNSRRWSSLMPATVGELIFMVALLAPRGAAADVIMVGEVVRDSRHGPPVQAVPVWAPGAVRTLSNGDGRFVLMFTRAEPGQLVALKAGNKDWQSVNDEELHTRLPVPGPPTEVHITIVVAKPSERAQRRAGYFGTATTDALDRSIGKQKAEVEAKRIQTRQETDSDRERAEFEYDAQRKQVFGLQALNAVHQRFREQLAEIRARATLSDDERNREVERIERASDLAFEVVKVWSPRLAQSEQGDGKQRDAQILFLRGHIDQASLLLSDERPEQEGNGRYANTERNTRTWQLRALLLVLNLDFDGASRAFEQAVLFGPDSFNAWFGRAVFDKACSRLIEARASYDRALMLAPDRAAREEVARGLSGLGALSRDKKQSAEARRHFEAALNAYRRLAAASPQSYRREVQQIEDTLKSLSP